MNTNKINPFKYEKEIKSKLLLKLKPMLTILTICGFNYDFAKRRILKYLIRTYCIFLAIFVAFKALIIGGDNIFSTIEFIAYFVIILRTKVSLKEFFKKISHLDVALQINENEYILTKKRVITCLTFAYLLRSAITYGRCTDSESCNSFSINALRTFQHYCLDAYRVWRIIFPYIILRRLKILRQKLEGISNNLVLLQVGHVLMENKLRSCLFIYKSIADAFEAVNTELHASIFVNSLCIVPRVIYFVYSLLVNIELSASFLAIVPTVVYLIHMSVFLFIPCVVAEMIVVEVETLRNLLVHQLIAEPDDSKKADIELFLKYTELKNFKYIIWRIVPLDVTLPMNLINLCTSFIIVTVNFSHLYD